MESLDTPIALEVLEQPQPLRYVTFTPGGALDGCYLQVPPDEHADRMLVIDESFAPVWVNYRANAMRDGLELLLPAVQPSADLALLKASAIEKTYADVDAVILAAVGNRAEEYKDAEAAARAFLASGDGSSVDVTVSSYALYNPTGQVQSNEWAAEQIIQRADAFRAAQKAMRAERFARQAQMRAVAAPAELAVVVEGWEAFIAAVRADLEL